MVKNEYYYVWDDNYSGCMMGKCLGNFSITNENKLSTAIFICTFTEENSLNIKSLWCYESTKRYYRKATFDEIDWLELCIKENKFVKKPEIKAYELW